MATLPRLYRHENGQFHVQFRFSVDGKLKQFHKSLKTGNEKEAESRNRRLYETMEAIEKGFLQPPSNGQFWDFLLSGGKLQDKPSVQKLMTLGELAKRYKAELPPGSLEANTLETHELHIKHLLRLFGSNAEVANLRPQDYISRRSREDYRGKPITATTIKKEIGALRKMCYWASSPNQGYIERIPHFKGLRYPKGDEKLPFQTWDEIEQKVKKGAEESLWDCLFLDTNQTEECLAFVKVRAAHPFIYPMFCFVAKTGARRSEMMRCRIEDLDLEKAEVMLREKKRNRKLKETFRRVQLPPLLVTVLKEWLSAHPGGKYLFCVGDTRYRVFGKTRSSPEPLTKNIARSHFEQTLKGSKWEVIRGFHTFRLSPFPKCLPI